MTPDSIALNLSIEEVNLILEGLGELPFRRVFQLIGRIQAAARAQIPTEQLATEAGADPAAAAGDHPLEGNG
jgi:hypothetical protein